MVFQFMNYDILDFYSSKFCLFEMITKNFLEVICISNMKYLKFKYDARTEPIFKKLNLLKFYN